MMTSPAWGRTFEHHGGGSGGAQHHSDNATALVDSAPYTKLEDPSMCIFWCACGLGALVRGRPVESVSSWLVRVLASEGLGFLSRSVALNTLRGTASRLENTTWINDS